MDTTTTPASTYLGRIADTGDHVPAEPGFKDRACRASFRGAIGDCVRPTGHDGPHQGAHLYAWTTADVLAQTAADATSTTPDHTGLLQPLRRYVTASTDDTTVRVDLPGRFYWDHAGRDLPSGEVVKVLARTVRVDLDRAAYDDLLSDAHHYAGEAMSEFAAEGGGGVCASARATLRVLGRTPRPSA